MNTQESVANDFLKSTYPKEYGRDSFPAAIVIALLAESDKAYQKYYKLFHKAQRIINGRTHP